MDELDIVRGLMLRTAGALPATAPLAKALLEWAEPHRPWLLPDMEGEWNWEGLLTGLATPRGGPVRAEALELAGTLARLLGLSPVDAALLRLMVACDRLPRVGALARLLSRHGHDLPQLLGEMAGASAGDAERAARRGAVTRLGLACFTANHAGEADVEIRWTLQRLLDRAPASEEAMLDTLVGRRQAATLGLDAFAHVEPIDFLVRLLRGALGQAAAGVNILIYGPPGTGKTELARTLAAAAGAVLHGVGEADEDGEEPGRWDRVAALALAQRLLGGRGPAVMLFDEMEDLIGDASPSAGGDWYDVLPLPDGAIGIAVGDVVGHDLAAAAAMGQLRGVLRSYAWDGGRPGSVLDRCDQLVQGLEMAAMATAVYARLEPDGARGHRLVHASAGHPPLLLRTPDGATRFVDGDLSPLIGAVRGVSRGEVATPFPPGSILVLHTDGLTDVPGADADARQERLCELVRDAPADVDVEELCDRIVAELAPGGDRHDDVALLCVRSAP